MRIALAIAVPVLAALVQGAVAGLISIGGAFPNMPVLAAASWSVAAGAREGLWWAFVGGIATDVLSAGPLGAFTFAILPGTLVVGLGERSSARPVPIIGGIFGVGIAALLTQVLYLGLLAFLGRPAGPAALTLAQTVGVALYTAALGFIAYPVARVARRITEQESPF